MGANLFFQEVGGWKYGFDVRGDGSKDFSEDVARSCGGGVVLDVGNGRRAQNLTLARLMAVFSLSFDRGFLPGVESATAARSVESPILALPVDCFIVLSPVAGIDEAPIACLCATFPSLYEG